MDHFTGAALLLDIFIAAQVLYAMTFLFDAYHFSRKVDWVRVSDAAAIPPAELPYIVLFYPVLDELEATMRTTFVSLTRLDYPADRYRVIAIPNQNDRATVERLGRLKEEFSFLEIISTPPTSDPTWQTVWSAWDANPKAYWWHKGPRAGIRDLPPKKTRQLIYAFYTLQRELLNRPDVLINYIDADSCPPTDHFMAGAAGMLQYDVLQSQNIAGNLLNSWAASWHAFDHMSWDGSKYPHLSAGGSHPFWMLGKGLFFRASDLLTLGGFHPWMTIEDPEVGMRFWKNGKRLGIIQNPLIEEVPLTFGRGLTQRKRWVCGFFQSLGAPLDALEFTFVEKAKAWTNFLPCLFLWVNAIGLPTGAWALWAYFKHLNVLPIWLVWLCIINLTAFTLSLILLYARTWKRSRLVLDSKLDRVVYLLRVNPVFLLIWWVMWLAPLGVGLWMYLRGHGLVWERTQKIDANAALIRSQVKAR